MNNRLRGSLRGKVRTGSLEAGPVPHRTTIRILQLGVLATLIPIGSALAADLGPWRQGGPPGGQIYSLNADAGSTGVVYATTQLGAMLRWSPHTRQWQPLSPTRPSQWIVTHPRNSGWLYAWEARSRDFGETWEPYHTRSALLIHPLDPRVQWAWGEGVLERTTDDGATWQALTPPVQDWGWFLLALHPRDIDTAWASTGSQGVLRTEDGGRTWHPARGGLEYTPSWGGGGIRYHLPRVLRATLDPDLVLWGFISPSFSIPDGSRVIRSVDGGLHWEILAPLSWAVDLAIHPTRPNTLYVLQGDHSVRVSEDAGASWRLLTGPVPHWHPCAHSLTDWATVLLVAPPDGTTLWYGTEARGVLVSTDGGESWASANRGIHFGYVTDVATSPRTPGRVFVADLARGVFRSDDAGVTWREPTPGVDLSWRVPGGWCPDNVGTPAEGARSVAVARAGETVVATFWGGASRSDDLGETWEYLPRFNSLVPRIVAIDQNRNRVYASNGLGVFRSDDGARTWQPCGFGPSKVEGLATHDASGTVIAWGPAGVAASGDACATWMLGVPLPSQACPDPKSTTTRIAFNPSVAGHAAAATSCGVFVSNQGIHQWRRGGLEGWAVCAVAFDALSPRSMYAVAGGRPWQSRDGGDSFEAIESWPLPGGATTLAVDTLGRRLYIGTSVFGLLSTELPRPPRPPISRLLRGLDGVQARPQGGAIRP